MEETVGTKLAIQERRVLPIVEHSPQPDPFEPQTWPEMLKFAEVISRTAFAPKDFMGKPEACAIAMLYGRQLGVGGLQALQGIAVINGRPSVYGDMFWAIITNHPDFKDVEEKTEDDRAWVKLTRRGRTPKEAEFTKKDAVTAGLWEKAGPWKQYPKTMMLWRARTIAARALFADALKGLTSNYEAEDYTAGPTIDSSEVKPQTATASVSAGKITQDQAREYSKACKEHGKSAADSKAALKSMMDVTSSLDIPADRYKDAMAFATGNPNWPDAAPEQSPDEKVCRELFGILQYDLAKQAEAIDAAQGDWSSLATKLNAELPAE